MTDLKDKSTEELQKLIEDAHKQLKVIQRSKRKEVIAKIYELAESVGITVEIKKDGKETTKSASPKQPPKYQNPKNPTQKWSGNGRKPNWIELDDSGKPKDEFLIKE